MRSYCPILRPFAFRPVALFRSLIACTPLALACLSPAQNSILLFQPVDVRPSAMGTGFGADGTNFNTANLSLACPAAPKAILSSSANGYGNVLVDNFLNVTVTAGGVTNGPTNVCPGGGIQNCFNLNYQILASGGSYTGQDPDHFVGSGGVPPINISSLLSPGSVQLQIALEDTGYGDGYYLSSSTLYLDTNCTQMGVTGPAVVNGNPIPGSDPTPQQLSQDFSFDSGNNQQIGFEYDLTTAQTDGTLTIADGTIPQVSDSPIDPSTFQSRYLSKTSFATANCLIHAGELLPSGAPACKLFTLLCAVGDGGDPSGAKCPISAQANEVLKDVFDGPKFTLSSIPTPGGPTFHEGIGFLMASDTWTGGPCTYEAAADLPNLPCPQNLLTSFTSSIEAAGGQGKGQTGAIADAFRPTPQGGSGGTSGSYTSSGRTTHPNSTFITVAGVPEDLTTVTVAGLRPGSWVNSSTPKITLSSQPPNVSGTTLPNAANFVPAPIESITYGISEAGSLPVPGTPVPTDTTLTNSIVCPTLANPTGVPAAVFSPAPFTLGSLPDGQYLLHYFAQDCAGTEELEFNQDNSGNWTTAYYTFPINIDTVPPAVSTPTLSPAANAQGTYTVGQSVTASFSCSDALSGVVQCGASTFAPGSTNITGALSSPVDTSTPGSKTFTVTAVDAAGNQATASVGYQVVSPYDNQVQLSISPQTVNYPQAAKVTVQIVPGVSPHAVAHQGKAAGTPITGWVAIFDGTKLLETLKVGSNGLASGFIGNLAAGKHFISATYSGDAALPSGTSAPVTFTVNPAPVNLRISCWNSIFVYGLNYNCGAYTSSGAGPAPGSISYSLDSGSPVTLPLGDGVVFFTLSKPGVGPHTIAVSYAGQGNFAAATSQSASFTVYPAPVNMVLTPSAKRVTSGNLTLSASAQSWSAGAPNTGSITFSHGGTVLGVVPVNASGQASITLAVSSLANGDLSFTATYGGGADYDTGTTSVVVVVAKN